MTTSSIPKIGYVPHTADLSAPGDRRRFVHYAAARNIPFELATPAKRYDLVILSERADITTWPRYPKGILVYDLIDSYLNEMPLSPRRILRGIFKYAKGEHKRLELDYRASVAAMCRRADAVICSTTEQQQQIATYCGNVHPILDIHTGETQSRKSDYSAGGRPFRIVWEGLTSNLKQLATIRQALNALAQERATELHIVTDPDMPRYFHHFGRIGTKEFCDPLFRNVNFHPWQAANFAQTVAACDLAVIPIDLTDSFAAGKPENKLILLWKAGLPVLASPTVAYRRTMLAAGVGSLPCTLDEWVREIRSMMDSETLRRHNAERGYRYAMEHYSENAILSRWDAAMRSVGFDFPAPHA
jgi:glycosyltransferase involved in cell wall biosynthesis